MTQHILIATHTEELEYDPAKVLAFLGRNPDVNLYGATRDEDKIIMAFQALNGSAYTDEALFASLANDDYGCELVEREEDE
jgi:hypothetical protein